MGVIDRNLQINRGACLDPLQFDFLLSLNILLEDMAYEAQPKDTIAPPPNWVNALPRISQLVKSFTTHIYSASAVSNPQIQEADIQAATKSWRSLIYEILGPDALRFVIDELRGSEYRGEYAVTSLLFKALQTYTKPTTTEDYSTPINTIARMFVGTQDLGINLAERALEPTPNEIRRLQWASLAKISELNIKGETVPVEYELYDPTNSDPDQRTGLFSESFVSEMALRFSDSWGRESAYAEGYYYNPQGIPAGQISDRFDPPMDQKIMRGTKPVDYWNRKRRAEIRENEKIVKGVRYEEICINTKDGGRQKRLVPLIEPARGEYLRTIGYEDFWSPEATFEYFRQAFTASKNYTIRVIRAKGEILFWLITYNINPREKLGGRDITINGEIQDEVAYIDTIGWSEAARWMPEETGHAKQSVSRKTMLDVTYAIANETRGVLLTRLNITHSTIVRFTNAFLGIKPVEVSPEEIGVSADVVKSPYSKNMGIIASQDDPTRAFHIAIAPGNRNSKVEILQSHSPVAQDEG